MTKPTCQTCLYWESIVDYRIRVENENHYPYWGEKDGGCHRMPSLVPTEENSWCHFHPDFPAYLESLKESEEVDYGFRCMSCHKTFSGKSQDGYCYYCYHSGRICE